jgi:hypothetical protein
MARQRMSVRTKISGSPPCSVKRQGSPWLESPLSLVMAEEEQDRSSLVKPASKKARLKREMTIPENEGEMRAADVSVMYSYNP